RPTCCSRCSARSRRSSCSLAFTIASSLGSSDRDRKSGSDPDFRHCAPTLAATLASAVPTCEERGSGREPGIGADRVNAPLDARRPARLLHTADCHLGAGTRGTEEAAFGRAIERAREESVDALLVAGDLFDHVRVSDETVRFAADRLASL